MTELTVRARFVVVGGGSARVFLPSPGVASAGQVRRRWCTQSQRGNACASGSEVGPSYLRFGGGAHRVET